MRKEYIWVCKNSLKISKKYKGEHLAIVDNKIVAHGKNLKKVSEKARKISPNPLFAENTM